MALTKDNTTTQRKFKHLSTYERGKIHILLKEGYSQNQIAKTLKRSPSTISREIKRGTTTLLNYDLSTYSAYFPETGQAVYEKHRSACGNKLKVLKVESFLKYAQKKMLKEKWSPDSIVGHALRTKKYSKDEIICSKTLYNYIDQNLLKVKNIDLLYKVRRKTKKTFTREHKRLNGKSISQRPKKIDNRNEFGHWEIDTVLGKRSKDNVLMTITERKTRQHLIRVLKSKESNEVNRAIKNLKKQFGPMAKNIFKSITADNGTEFAGLDSNDIDIYYAHPYSAWERGSNERHNGLIRRFIPKGQSIKDFTEDQINRIQNWCNNYPRKIFDYQTPEQLFITECEKTLNSA